MDRTHPGFMRSPRCLERGKQNPGSTSSPLGLARGNFFAIQELPLRAILRSPRPPPGGFFFCG
eukprot:8662775-Pyramimonas_sp.AAC.1